jgi:hypothetical protein
MLVISKLFNIIKIFDAEKINELTSDLRIKKAKNTQVIEKHLKKIEEDDNDPDYEDMIHLLKKKVIAIEADNLKLEQ